MEENNNVAQETETVQEEMSEDLKAMVQRLVEESVRKADENNRRLANQLEKLKKEKLTVEEQNQLNLEAKEQELREREAALHEKESREYALKAIKKAGLDDGSDRALALVDFVMGQDEKEIDEKVKAFDELFRQFVKAEVDKTFKASGRSPQSGSEGGSVENPYLKDTWNFTKQNELEVTNPQEAKRLREAAGIH